jgi:uncharacterized membrane protein
MISLKKGRRVNLAFWIAIATAILFSFRNIFLKLSLLEINLLSTLFWISIGGLMVSIILFAIHHPHIRSKAKIHGIEHLILAGIISAMAFFFFTISTFEGYVSLITAITSTQVLFVFIIAILLSKFKPKIIHEETRKSVIEMKILAIAIIISGVAIIS